MWSMPCEYDTDEFPLHCHCGLRVKDMECFGPAKANSDYIIHRGIFTIYRINTPTETL